MKTPFWKTERAKIAREYFSGNVMDSIIVDKQTNKALQGDTILTEEGDMFKFKHGIGNTNHDPILIFIKHIDVPEFPIDKRIDIDDMTWLPLGEVTIYKLDKNEYLWEY